MAPHRPTRLPWRPDFPDVVIHTDVKSRDSDPGYMAAKSGDADAALQLAKRLLVEDAVQNLRALIGDRKPLILPVIADETLGFNAIPDAMANVLAQTFALEVVAGEIVQTNKVGHTRARTFQRLITPAAFDGSVQPGRDYLLVDDHVGLGGTLANLKGYVETGGATVIAMTTLTESLEGRRISLRSDTLGMLESHHGEALDTLWRGLFDHGIDCLTELEAQNLTRQKSVAEIENFLAKAAIEARRRGLKPRI